MRAISKLKFKKIISQLKLTAVLLCLCLILLAASFYVFKAKAFGPVLTASLNLGTPPPGLTAKSSNTLIAVFNLTATNGDISFDGPTGAGPNAGNSLAINLENGCTWPVVATSLTLKDEAANTLDVISGVNLCTAATYTFDFSDNDLYIVSGQTDRIYLYADTTSLGSNYVIQAALLDDVAANVDWSFNYDGGHYQTADTSFSGDIYANPLFFDGPAQIVRPVFSLAPGSPSGGMYAPGVKTLLAVFNIAAQGDDITFESRSGNSLTVDIGSACDGPGSLGNLILEDQAHNQLDSVPANLCLSGSYYFDFADSDLTIPGSNMQPVYIYGDTSSGNVSGVYAWLNNDDPLNIGWSVASDGYNYSFADSIFSPPIYGNVLIDGGSLSEAVNPTAVFTAPTKIKVGSITDTTVELRDNWAISNLTVDFSNSTAGLSNINCAQSSLNIVNCTLTITSSGDVIVYGEDAFGNSVQVVEVGYDVTQPTSSGARTEVLAQPVPICQLLINSGQAATSSPEVTLDLASSTTVAEMIFANNINFVGSAWQPYSQQASWVLENENSGTKILYAMVKDAVGRLSEACSDTIEFVSAPATSEPNEEEIEELPPLPLEPIIAEVKPGEVFKISGNPTIYFMGNDNRRHIFPNQLVYNSWFADFSPVKTLTDAEQIVSIPLGLNVTIRPGTWLIKIQSDPKVYAVEPQGKLRWITTEGLAQALYGQDWMYQVKDIDPALFVDYEIGADISTSKHPEGTLIQYQNQSAIYYIDQNSYKVLVQPDIFSVNYFQDRFVIKDFQQTIEYPGNAILVSGPLSSLISFE